MLPQLQNLLDYRFWSEVQFQVRVEMTLSYLLEAPYAYFTQQVGQRPFGEDMTQIQEKAVALLARGAVTVKAEDAPKGSAVVVGERHGEWGVIDTLLYKIYKGQASRGYVYFAPCRCSCGTRSLVNVENMRRGLSLSCGCVPHAKLIDKATTHGMSKTPIYAVWNMMKQRVFLETNHAYKYYGGRGVDMDPRWLNFDTFYADMGNTPFAGASLDRVDNERGYWPDNVRWSTRTQQARNTRRNVRFEYRGKTLLLSEWAEATGLRLSTLNSRIYSYAWPIEKALTEPVRHAGNSRVLFVPNAV